MKDTWGVQCVGPVGLDTGLSRCDQWGGPVDVITGCGQCLPHNEISLLILCYAFWQPHLSVQFLM